MKSNAATGCLKFLTTELFPITISIISLLLSSFNLYVDYLKSPDISFVVAPYISHVVDASSGNEAFFIPVTVINRGAQPGTVLSFDLTVMHLPTQRQIDYGAQYYAQEGDVSTGEHLFTPMSLQGYSTDSQTVGFYPVGSRQGNFFSATGVYEFQVHAAVTNVKNQYRKEVSQVFRISLTDEMFAVMQSRLDSEYPYPMKIEMDGSGT